MSAEPLLHNRIAVVTGAGRNIGRAIAIRLAAAGAAVVVNDVSAGTAHETAELIQGNGGTALAAPGDMSHGGEVDAVFEAAERDLGTASVLVNNAYWPGLEGLRGSLLTAGEVDWRAFVDTNMALFFLSTKRAARGMATAGIGGSVVNISSYGAQRAHRNMIAYDTVKGAMDAFTRATALDLAPWGIRVNTVRPGAIGVDVRPGGTPDPRAGNADQIPLGRMGKADDIAGAVLFLASELSAYVTGQAVTVDGGVSVQARPPVLEPHWTPDLTPVRRQLGI